MIAKFTNSRGEINFGIVIGDDPSGMVYVLWDAYASLLSRLETQGRVTTFERNGLGVHKGWVRAPNAGPNGSMTELLPNGTPVQWSCEELRQAHISAKES